MSLGICKTESGITRHNNVIQKRYADRAERC